MDCNALSYRWKETGSRFPTDSLKKKRLYLPSKSYPELNQPKWSVKIGALGLTRKPLFPLLGSLMDGTPQIHLQTLIDPLGLTISLRMIGRAMQ